MRLPCLEIELNLRARQSFLCVRSLLLALTVFFNRFFNCFLNRFFNHFFNRFCVPDFSSSTSSQVCGILLI